jgi:mannose-6-phosphate isomerase-like protein (cupin superfamily)
VKTLQFVVVCVIGVLVAAILANGQNSQSNTAGIVVQPEEGEVLDFCNTPELSVNIKVNPGPNGPQFTMGTGELAAQSDNFSTHEVFDEVIFIHRGKGSVTLGEENFPAGAGTTMYIPRGVYHRFVNTGDAPWVFVWITSPPGFEKLARQWDLEDKIACASTTEN